MTTSAVEAAPFVKPILAHSYDPARVDPGGFWVSEKFDGVRACWTGDRLLTRTGKPIHAPADWTAALPRGVALDGELTLGRGRFQDTVSIVRTKKPGREAEWAAVRYHVFDAPAAAGPFEERLAAVARVAAASPVVDAVAQERCRGPDHLEDLLRSMLGAGGEGLMLRAAGSPYEPGKRTRARLKVKRFHDAEAVVVAHVAGRGKHKGRLGALRVACAETGAEFKIGTGFTDEQRGAPPAVGTTVTYKYQEKTRAGVPRFPVYLRVRPTE
jgi:DNA ligase-1